MILNMKVNKTKVKISISIDRNIDDIINEEFDNKSKYIEWLIYQDLKKYSKNEKINKIII
jgi:metal-responsive CopG/Arc/MetJ family transcriptional regulator